MKFIGNGVVFVLVYILGMIPTYILPYVGSNSSVGYAASAAVGGGSSPAFLAHLGCLLLLITITWFRGSFINKRWLIIFPVLAAAFDLIPGLSSIPFVPTVMHLLAVILGVVGAQSVQLVTEK